MSLDPFITRRFFIGTAAWNIPASSKPFFPEAGSHLERYAQKFSAVEINSSFYRHHKPQVYARWAASVPDDFRFSVKLSRAFTHELRLKETGEALRETIYAISALGDKWGVLLVQLPPSLEFQAPIAKKFLHELRSLYSGPIAWEPRHRSWAEHKALHLLEDYNVTKVQADPETCPVSAVQAPSRSTCVYYRLHGSPEIYRSRYSEIQLRNWAHEIKLLIRGDTDAWCIFDNTSFGYATENALELQNMLTPSLALRPSQVQIFMDPP